MSTQLFSQKVAVYKIDNLLKRIHNNSDTLYIVNFWATWCKPCVAELPDFEKINAEYKTQKVKVLLVSMDFKEDIAKKLKPFIQKNNTVSEVVLLDELSGNEFIDKVSKQWGGAIPATLFTKKNNTVNEFFEKKLHYEFLVEQITKYK
jgi:thiol-disulfide isomerase/thioredoxin